ncbi:uncharacterized protein METZ01_LOCUS385562 [marine metagenome]|uniref:Uncharacterized protein n=1 Tax=marine metagenome TaxID=408172 RepID=A0A382UG74_9ZZZZ
MIKFHLVYSENYSINADKSGRMNLLGDAPKPSKNMYLDAYGSPGLS